MHYVKVAAADAGCAYFDVYLTRLWRVQFDFFYGQGLSYFPENGSFHVPLLGQRDGTDSTRVLRILPGRGRSAFVAGAEGAKEFIGVDACVVEVAPQKAQSVAANLHPVQRHYVTAYIRDGDEPLAGHFMDADGASALGAQVAVLKEGVVAIVPADMDSVR